MAIDIPHIGRLLGRCWGIWVHAGCLPLNRLLEAMAGNEQLVSTGQAGEILAALMNCLRDLSDEARTRKMWSDARAPVSVFLARKTPAAVQQYIVQHGEWTGLALCQKLFQD